MQVTAKIKLQYDAETGSFLLRKRILDMLESDSLLKEVSGVFQELQQPNES